MNKIVTAIYFISLLFIWYKFSLIFFIFILSYYTLNALILSSFYEACNNSIKLKKKLNISYSDDPKFKSVKSLDFLKKTIPMEEKKK